MVTKRVTLLLLSALLFACGERKEIVVTANLGVALSGLEITALRLVLYEGVNSGTAVFDDGGEPINFPVTLSTRVSAARFGELRVGLVALDANGRSLGGGFTTVDLSGDGTRFNASVLIDSEDPFIVGDGADEGSCVNTVDDDGNGITDCLEEACVTDLPECGGACGDGIVDFYRGELCDDGNTIPGDGCDEACVSEVAALSGFLQYFQLTSNNQEFVIMGQIPIFDALGIFNVGDEEGDCQIAGFTPNPLFDLFSVGQIGSIEFVNDADGTVLRAHDIANGVFQVVQASDATPGTAVTLRNAGGAALGAQDLVSFSFPEKLQAITPPLDIFRGQDYRLEWTDPGVGEDVFLTIFDFLSSQSIFCQVPASDGGITIPGRLTRFLQRSTVADGAGAVIQIGSGFRQSLDIGLEVRVMNGAEFLVDVQ